MSGSKNNMILVIEDDFDIREVMKDSLEDEGYEVAVAENGSEALKYLAASTALPTLILLDSSMPVMDGYSFRTEQMKSERISKIPTVMVSADGAIKDKSEKAGVTEFLKKPVELSDLIKLVNRYCGRN